MSEARNAAEHRPVVTCEPQDGGWRCTVVIGEDAGATRHEVTVDRETLEDLAPSATPEVLVAESFAILLEREPRESIMRRFELPIIGRFFGDYPDEIRRRLAS
ncbi:MAG TPA: hypothetical protein VM253_10245 [Candidatus Limnocylindrales bacterium]|jgi:hypothetical protein|nr:hypothetical protein [Candidatus Limnocylindrales bacterium]